MRWVAKRARKSEQPQVRAVRTPRRIPMRSEVFRGRRAFSHWQAEYGHHFLQVFPDFALGARIAQQVGGVISGHEFAAAEIDPLSPIVSDSAIGLKQSLHRDCPEANDHFGSDGIKLTKQKG